MWGFLFAHRLGEPCWSVIDVVEVGVEMQEGIIVPGRKELVPIPFGP